MKEQEGFMLNRSIQLSTSMDPRLRSLARRFDSHLEQAKPYLFNLADQLLDDYPSIKWNVLIGEDTGGRLPTRFIRKAFQFQGIHIPTYYIHASAKVRGRVPVETFTTYVKRIFGEISASSDSRRPLVITESALSYNTLRFINKLLVPEVAFVDFAIVASKSNPPEEFSPYMGAVGEKEQNVIADTFEKVETGNRSLKILEYINDHLPPRLHARIVGSKIAPTIPRLPTYPSNNLTYSSSGDLPVAEITQDKRYRRLAAYCFARMDEFAAEFSHGRSS